MSQSLPHTLLPTTLVGSYPQPDWLIDRGRLAEIVPPRARARELWRVEAAWLEQAQDDATLLAIRDQERAGIDVVTDGEMRRESYSNRFATALEGMDSEHPAEIPSRTPGRVQIVPRVVGPIRRRQPVQARDVAFLRANTDRPIKITIPGPFTMPSRRNPGRPPLRWSAHPGLPHPVSAQWSPEREPAPIVRRRAMRRYRNSSPRDRG